MQTLKKNKRKAQSKKQEDGENRLFLVEHPTFIAKFTQFHDTCSAFCVSLDVDSSEYCLRDALFTACKIGDVGSLCSLLQLPQEVEENCEKMESNPSMFPSPMSLLNKPIDSSGFTLLHVAAAAAQKAVVWLLLDAGADPARRYKEFYCHVIKKVVHICRFSISIISLQG